MLLPMGEPLALNRCARMLVPAKVTGSAQTTTKLPWLSMATDGWSGVAPPLPGTVMSEVVGDPLELKSRNSMTRLLELVPSTQATTDRPSGALAFAASRCWPAVNTLPTSSEPSDMSWRPSRASRPGRLRRGRRVRDSADFGAV